MTNYPNIALAGRMGTGKSTIAYELLARYNYSIESLAKPIRGMLEQAYNGIDKSRVYRIATPEGVFDRSGRELMQILGTDAIRDLVDQDFWIRCLFNRLQITPKPWVVDDVRFPNEAQALEGAGFYIVRLVRPGIPLSDHPTETLVDDLDAHLEIQNTASPREVASWLMLAVADMEQRRLAQRRATG